MRVLFFFNDTATTEIYTLSLHDALPISRSPLRTRRDARARSPRASPTLQPPARTWSGPIRRALALAEWARSEEHTSELQSLAYLVCRLLLEKKNLDVLHRPSRLLVHEVH